MTLAETMALYGVEQLATGMYTGEAVTWNIMAHKLEQLAKSEPTLQELAFRIGELAVECASNSRCAAVQAEKHRDRTFAAASAAAAALDEAGL